MFLLLINKINLYNCTVNLSLNYDKKKRERKQQNLNFQKLVLKVY